VIGTRRITKEFKKLTTKLDKHDAESTRVYLIAGLTALVLLAGLTKAYKNTMGTEAIKTRKSLQDNGYVTYKTHHYGVLNKSVIKGIRGRVLDREGSDTGVFAQTSEKPALLFKGASSLKTKPATLAMLLSEASEIPEEDLLKIIAKKWNGYIVQRNLNPYKVKMIKKITDTYGGFTVKNLRSRVYPTSYTASNVIGLLNRSQIPLMGIEKSFNSVLTPDQEQFKVLRDHSMRRRLAVNIKKAQTFDPYSIDGKDVVLTLDQRIQVLAHVSLERRVQALKAKGGAVVVMDPYTFEVLAMATAPAIDMQKYRKACTGKGIKDNGSSPCTNKAVEYAYEPGSVGKIFSLTTAIDHKVVGLKSMLNTHHGSCTIGRNRVQDTHYSKSAWITVLEATKKSSNCAFAFLGQKLGPKMLYNGLKLLGLGQRTGIRLPHESRGYVKDLKYWIEGVTDAGMSYGYGYRATPLQIAQAVSVIANGGRMGHAHIKLKVQTRKGKPLPEKETESLNRIISPQTAAAVRKAMIAVTEKGGTGTLAVPEGYCVGGKTGTAKMVIKKRYRKGRYVATFAGFAPCDKPKIVIVVTIIDPKSHKFGGSAAGPVFRDLVEKTLPILGVSPKKMMGKL